MNAYLFAAVFTWTKAVSDFGYDPRVSRMVREMGASHIVFANDSGDAQKQFEAWMQTPDPNNPGKIEFNKVTAAQFVDQLITETGNTPLDWPQIQKQALTQMESTPDDDFEQGYWVDANQLVFPQLSILDIEELKSKLTDETRSGLNWSPDKQFLFVLSVLPPLPTPPDLDAPDLAPTVGSAASAESSDENPDDTEPDAADVLDWTLSAAVDKEADALIQARNSVVAAWLWRRYAVNNPLANNPILIEPWCGTIEVTK